MKTLVLAAAAVLAIGAGAARAESGEIYGWDQPSAQPAGQVVKTSMTTAGSPYSGNVNAAIYNGNG